MKKKILIIGNDNGLPGVKVDITNFQTFFKSAFGGNWQDPEIDVKVNCSLTDLRKDLSSLKGLNLDYLIIIFSGHGGQKRETVLELNSKGETIGDSELQNIAKRQLNIYDCCRSIGQQTNESLALVNKIKLYSAFNTREKYEKRIMQAINQQVSLYSCSVGEVSNDTSEGGLYSKHFIDSAKNINSEYKLVGEAHTEAYNLVVEANKYLPKDKHQHPESVLPRCLSDQQLIISINPNK